MVRLTHPIKYILERAKKFRFMRKERYAAFLILLAFFSGMLITAATSGCDSHSDFTAQSPDFQPETSELQLMGKESL